MPAPSGIPRDWRRRPGTGMGGFRRWLLDRGSLTERLRARCPALQVRAVRRDARRAAATEAASVGVRPGAAFVREAMLCCGAEPVVFARSVARRRDLRGAWRALARLGSRPLGAVLFRDPRVRRRPFSYRRLNGRDRLRARAVAALGASLPVLWARRSLFVRSKSPILVTEIFLPGILRL